MAVHGRAFQAPKLFPKGDHAGQAGGFPASDRAVPWLAVVVGALQPKGGLAGDGCQFSQTQRCPTETERLARLQAILEVLQLGLNAATPPHASGRVGLRRQTTTKEKNPTRLGSMRRRMW